MNRKVKLMALVAAAVAALAYLYVGTDLFNNKDVPVAAPPEDAAAGSAMPETPAPAPLEDVALRIVNASSGEEVLLDGAALMALPHVTINTENEFVDAMTSFTGPLARDVLALVGGVGSTVVLTAVNDYAVEVPVEDFMKYDVVFAMSADGVRFSRRDKGPIWVIYPMSENPELQDPVYNARLIWQLVKVELK